MVSSAANMPVVSAVPQNPTKSAKIMREDSSPSAAETGKEQFQRLLKDKSAQNDTRERVRDEKVKADQLRADQVKEPEREVPADQRCPADNQEPDEPGSAEQVQEDKSIDTVPTEDTAKWKLWANCLGMITDLTNAKQDAASIQEFDGSVCPKQSAEGVVFGQPGQEAVSRENFLSEESLPVTGKEAVLDLPGTEMTETETTGVQTAGKEVTNPMAGKETLSSASADLSEMTGNGEGTKRDVNSSEQYGRISKQVQGGTTAAMEEKLSGEAAPAQSASEGKENAGTEALRPAAETNITKTNAVKTSTAEKSGQSGMVRESGEQQSQTSELSSSVSNVQMTRHTAPDAVSNTSSETVFIKAEQPEVIPQKVLETLTGKMAEQAKEFEIQLEPQNLGKIAIKVMYEQGRAAVSILCTNAKTSELLAQSAKDIGSIMEMNTGNPTTILVEKSAEDYLNQNQNQHANQERGQQEQNAQKDQAHPANQDKESMDFIQQLRLGLVATT